MKYLLILLLFISPTSYAGFVTAKEAHKKSQIRQEELKKEEKLSFYLLIETEIDNSIQQGKSQIDISIYEEDRKFAGELTNKLVKLGYTVLYGDLSCELTISW